jgi:hypothetical protein
MITSAMNANKALWRRATSPASRRACEAAGRRSSRSWASPPACESWMLIERFTAAGVPKEQISFQKGTFTLNFPGSPSELLAEFRTYYGPTMNAFEAASSDGREADLQAELEALFNEQNTSATATSIPATSSGDGPALTLARRRRARRDTSRASLFGRAVATLRSWQRAISSAG